MDSINEIAKILNTIKDTSDFAAKRKQRKKRVERATDTFDTLVPFSMDFLAGPKNNVTVSLYFKPPAPSACCGTCYCSVCEQFSNNITITLTYGYISGTLNVFVGSDIHNAVQVTNFTELDPAAGTLSLGTTGAFIRVCYIYFAGGCDPLGAQNPCGITDTFTRSATNSWGISTANIEWLFETPGDEGVESHFSVNGSSGVFHQTYVQNAATPFSSIYLPVPNAPSMEGKITISDYPPVASSTSNLPLFRQTYIILDNGLSNTFSNYIAINYSYDLNGSLFSSIDLFRDGGSGSLFNTWTNTGSGQAMTLHFLINSTSLSVNFWPASQTEPNGWMFTTNGSASFTPAFAIMPGWQGGNAAFSYSENIKFDNLDIVDVNNCT